MPESTTDIPGNSPTRMPAHQTNPRADFAGSVNDHAEGELTQNLPGEPIEFREVKVPPLNPRGGE